MFDIRTPYVYLAADICKKKNVIIFTFVVDRYRVICDINNMRRDTKTVYTTKSESRFTLYELKSMVQRGDIGTFWRSPVQRVSERDAAQKARKITFTKAWHFFTLTASLKGII
tara:strand:+ start:271 stop:609 length:339 start_codon:yes stop_codon:yes gene_type:complete